MTEAGGEIPAFAGMTEAGGRDSRLRGNDGGKAGALRADWIPACAGMTEGKGAREGKGSALQFERDSVKFREIPPCY